MRGSCPWTSMPRMAPPPRPGIPLQPLCPSRTNGRRPRVRRGSRTVPSPRRRHTAAEGLPNPPPSQRLFAYLDRGLIQSLYNASKRNAENPPEDHQHSSSIKRPCTQPQNGKVAELEIINAAFCETNQKHPAFSNRATPLGIEPFSNAASNQPTLGTGVRPCVGHQGQGQSPK